MKKILTITFLSLFCISQTFALTIEQKKDITKSLTNDCKDIKESDIPTIFIPWIAASWYSEEGFSQTKVKRWIPDPITHVYDPLFYTFKENGYTLEDVFYDDEFTLHIEWNPKGALYLFGYDWKKDNRITATLLSQLIGLIYKKYEEENHGCKLTRVNIVAHSMGGLVARSMLEDMCVKVWIENKHFSIEGYYELNEKWEKPRRNWLLFKPKSISCTNPINPNQPIKVSRLITISTPQRGSPKSFPLWEKGNMLFADGLEFDFGIKSQINTYSLSDKELYKNIHGYSEKIPNGIVGLGQLLPDIWNDTSYNRSLLYLKQGDITFPASVHPQNSFLEELNKTENINKMWSKIEKMYVEYYSLLTWISEGWTWNSNIVAFEIAPDYRLGWWPYRKNDESSKVTWKDIYQEYSKNISENYYNIEDSIQKEDWTAWDGTVPSKNLRLVPNDSKDWKEVTNPKFYSEEIKCYDPVLLWYNPNRSIENNTLGENIVDDIVFVYKGYNKESLISKGMGEDSHLQMCAHTMMPIATSVKVFEKISNMDIHSDINSTRTSYKERNKILEYLWYATYLIPKWDENLKVDYNWIMNYSLVDWFFRQDHYIKTNTSTEPISLSFWDSLKSILRYDILSPINVLITDEQGRRIGIDPDTGKIINEIPWAWTSGDTAGSNEPEFFLIPDTLSGKLTHKIETFGTGDGVYHIEMREIAMNSTGWQENNGITKLLTIAGNTKEGFGQEYKVVESQTGTTQGNPTFSFTNVSDYPAKIETQLDTYVTLQDTFTLRYSVKWDGKNVAKIQVETTDSKGIKTTNSYTINGEIPLSLKEIGSTKVTLTLLDKSGKPLTYDGAKKVITIKKIENIAKQSLTISGATLSQESLDLYEKNKAKRSLFDFSSFFK